MGNTNRIRLRIDYTNTIMTSIEDRVKAANPHVAYHGICYIFPGAPDRMIPLLQASYISNGYPGRRLKPIREIFRTSL